jgi:hypothetical protein
MVHTSGMTTIVVLGLFWLFGPGLLALMLFGPRRDEQNKLPSRIEHLRATSTYLPLEPGPKRTSPSKSAGLRTAGRCIRALLLGAGERC